MNAPLMLGLDLRRISVGDDIYNIIANKKVIDLSQDPLGVQAKRIYCSMVEISPDTEYVTDEDRVDILAKPLADGSVAISFINVSQNKMTGAFSVTKDRILEKIGAKMVQRESFEVATKYEVEDLWSESKWEAEGAVFAVNELNGCDNVTLKVKPL